MMCETLIPDVTNLGPLQRTQRAALALHSAWSALFVECHAVLCTLVLWPAEVWSHGAEHGIPYEYELSRSA